MSSLVTTLQSQSGTLKIHASGGFDFRLWGWVNFLLLMICWIQFPISKTVKPWVVWFWFTIIFNSWKSSHTFKWSWETTIEIIFEMDLWYLGNVMLGPKFNSAIVAPNLKSNDTFCWGDKFCGRPVWFIDKIWNFGNQWPVSDPSPTDHSTSSKVTFLFLDEIQFSSSIESGRCNLIYWQGHSWIFLRCGRALELTFETSQVLLCHYQVSSATLPLSKPQHYQWTFPIELR